MKSHVMLMALAACLCLDAVEPTSRDEAFTLATFNIRRPMDKGENAWTNRLPRILKIIADRRFDLIGIQEAMPEQVRDLAERLPGWEHVGVGRCPNDRDEATCIFFRADRFALCASGTFWLSETPDVPGSKSWKSAWPRICTWAQFRDKRTGLTFRHYNTHLDHKSKLARFKGVKLILERIQALPKDEAVFLTGDFNAVSPSAGQADAQDPIPLVLSVLVDAKTVSATPHQGSANTVHGYRVKPRRGDGCIDYVFVSPNVRVLSHATCNDRPEGKFASDHDPVAIRVERVEKGVPSA